MKKEEWYSMLSGGMIGLFVFILYLQIKYYPKYSILIWMAESILLLLIVDIRARCWTIQHEREYHSTEEGGII